MRYKRKIGVSIIFIFFGGLFGYMVGESSVIEASLTLLASLTVAIILVAAVWLIVAGGEE